MQSDDKPHEVLSELLGHVLAQQQFAEAKNGALLTLCVAIIMGLGAIVGSTVDSPWWLVPYSIWMSIGLGAAGLLGLFSFLPRLSKGARAEATEEGPVGNPYFFMDVAEMGERALVRELYRKLKIEAEPGELVHDIANQICTNAIVARRKHRIFRWAAQLCLLSLLMPSLCLGWTTQVLGWR